MPKVFVKITKAHMIARCLYDNSKLEQELLMFDKINNLIANRCDIVIDKSVYNEEELCSQIIDKL
jgi:hypothetical protein